uniref:Purple acid phosphatase n=1 Tax=Neobodo designis TaxID=312471 RepID=A0A7S1QIU4_NEODS
MIAAFAALAQMATTVLLAGVAGYGFIPPWVAFVVSASLWIPAVGFCMIMTGSSWRTAFLITTAAKKGLFDRDNNDTEENGPRCSAVVSLVRATALVVMKNPFVFWVTSVFSFVFVLSVVIAFAGVCWCTNPDSFTTWASRRTEAKFCLPEQVCHVYPLLGHDPSRLRIVGHVISLAGPPLEARVEACEVASAAGPCVAPSWSLTTAIVDHAHIEEDRRYLVHALATNLSGSTPYRFTVVFVLAQGVVTDGATTVRTVPGIESDEPVVLLGGGDYHSSGTGIAMLRAGLVEAPDAHVLYVGGDLSYANNLRTCYLRWDRFLHAMSTIVNADGFSLPLLTIPGNHESGGYLEAGSNREEYYFYAAYLPQYDLDWPEDRTITFHSHRIASHVGLVALDSGLMVPVSDQVEFLKGALISLRGFDPDVVSQPNASVVDSMRFVIPLYHNAVYGSTTRSRVSAVDEMKRRFLPLFDVHKIPLVLEFHEHTYKRTFAMNQGNIRTDGDGVVYLGDGALGVYSDSRELGHYDYIAREAAANYITILRVFANGTCHGSTIDAAGFGGRVYDEFVLRKRV